MEINKLKALKTLTQYSQIWNDEIDLSPLMDCGEFEGDILLNKENDKWEKYEIFLAVLLNLNLIFLQEDEFELNYLLLKAFYNQSKIMQEDVDACEDKLTADWKHFSDEYFHQQLASQSTNYAK